MISMITTGSKGFIMVIITIVVGGLLLTMAFVWAEPRVRRALLGWYMREVRRIEVAQAPGDARATYPLA
jgi:hypothetical protein